MELLVDQARFHSALALAASVADRRGTMPVLSNVLLAARSDNTLLCSATDTNIYLTERVPAEIEATGSLTVSVKHLVAVLKTLHAGPLRLKSLENNRAQLTSGRSEFRIVGLPERDFPPQPSDENLEYITVPTGVLSTLLQKTIFSVSTDEARVNLNGALFRFDEDNCTMVSTDGRRLTACRSDFSIPALTEKSIVIPRKGLLELRKVLERMDENLEMAIGDQYLFVKSPELQLAIKLSNVSFPPYEQVIPKSHKRSAIVPRQEIISALRSAEVIAPEKTATVRLEFSENTLQVTADNPELGVSNQKIEIEYNDSELVIGFNARYLIEALEATPGEFVQLRFQGELDPCLIEPTEDLPETKFTAVVMPMRI